MKVLLCERALSGHRKEYMKWLFRGSDIDSIVFAPENFGIEETHFIKNHHCSKMKSVKEYWLWLKQMRSVIKDKDIDIVHFLDGDSIMRYFGVGFGCLGVKRIIITYHHFYSGFLRRISYQLMCRKKNWLPVVHTNAMQQALWKVGLKNVERCEYPAFGFESMSQLEPLKCKAFFGLTSEVPTIGIIGGLSTYKNIIPFLEAMQKCKVPFHLLICGKEFDISKTIIEETAASYIDKTTLVIRHLNDEEYRCAIMASDIIFCIYGHEFDGASGPLADGVCAKKMILSCKHGSLGEIVSQNHLGLCVECDNKGEILRQTEVALCLAKKFEYDEKANQYREALRPLAFQGTYKRIYNVK